MPLALEKNNPLLNDPSEVVADGKEIGVQGTPTFVVNGKVLVGAVPLSQFEAIIKEASKGG